MGRQPCCEKVGLKKGPWTGEEDKKLVDFILKNGQCCWRALPKLAGLLRCGKSCRLRWTNYLRPDVKRGLLSETEENLVIQLHAQLGNRWSKIASHLPGRTDNEIKNHWNTHIKKKLKKMGLDPLTHKPLPLTPSHKQPPAEKKPSPEAPGHMNKEEQIATDPSLEPTSLLTSQSTINNLILTKDDHGIQAYENGTFDFDHMNLVNTTDFGLDEIPVVEPHEILRPDFNDNFSSSSANTLDKVQLSPNINDIYSQILISDLLSDDFTGLDFLIPSDYDLMIGVGNNVNNVGQSHLVQCPIMGTETGEQWSMQSYTEPYKIKN